MSFSLQPPEEPPVCECRYDEIHDVMDREDCAIHCDFADLADSPEPLALERKRATVARGDEREDVA